MSAEGDNEINMQSTTEKDLFGHDAEEDDEEDNELNRQSSTEKDLFGEEISDEDEMELNEESTAKADQPSSSGENGKNQGTNGIAKMNEDERGNEEISKDVDPEDKEGNSYTEADIFGDEEDEKNEDIGQEKSEDTERFTAKGFDKSVEVPIEKLKVPKGLKDIGAHTNSDGGGSSKHGIWVLRLPNSFRFEQDPFSEKTFKRVVIDLEKEQLPPEFAVRWRNHPLAEGGRESNARIITWSDGSRTLNVGKDHYNLDPVTSGTFQADGLYAQASGPQPEEVATNALAIARKQGYSVAEEQAIKDALDLPLPESVLVCHGRVSGRLAVRPLGKNEAMRMLNQLRKEKKLLSRRVAIEKEFRAFDEKEEQRQRKKQLQEIEKQQKMTKARKRREKARREKAGDSATLDKNFLEGEDDALDNSDSDEQYDSSKEEADPDRLMNIKKGDSISSNQVKRRSAVKKRSLDAEAEGEGTADEDDEEEVEDEGGVVMTNKTGGGKRRKVMEDSDDEESD